MGRKSSSSFTAPTDNEKAAKLLSQLQAKVKLPFFFVINNFVLKKVKWLEDELYKTNEIRVRCHIIQAQGLSGVDPNGLSDPFCVVKDYKTSSGGIYLVIY